MFNAFNKWYDALQEPWRFLLAMTLAMSGIIGLSIGNGPVKVAAAVYLLLLLLIRIAGRLNAAV